MYYLNSDKANYAIYIPESIHEITNDMLDKITKHINIAPHYSLIALLYKTSLFKLASKVNNNVGDDYIKVLPVFVRANYDNCNSRNLSPVEEDKGLIRPIIAPSVIERGYEVYVSTAMSLQSVLGYIQNDYNLRNSLINKTYKGNVLRLGVENPDAKTIAEDNNTNIYMIGFKVVATNDIVAGVPYDYAIYDPAYKAKVEVPNS